MATLKHCLHRRDNYQIVTLNKESYLSLYLTFLSSTSKTSVEFGGMTGGDPFAPYL